jgi:hypothetical protein
VAVVRGRLGLTAILVLAAMLLGVESAAACSCQPIRPTKLLKHADAAFNGRLLSVRPKAGTPEAAFRYRIGVVAKGPFRRGQVVTLWSANSDAICGLTQGVGDLYGLFVSQVDGRWVSGTCGLIPPRVMRRTARGRDVSMVSTGCAVGG